MIFTFTVCSNNYLAQATVLGNSLKVHNPSYRFIIFLVDEKHESINYDEIGHEIIPVHLIEAEFRELSLKYDIIELNTAIKPRVVEYLFKEKNAEKVIYLDPDVKVYARFEEL